MARLKPAKREDLEELEPIFKLRDQDMGFTSNSMLTMARWPELSGAWMALGRVVMFAEGTIPLELKGLIAHVRSRASGCLYCTAHSGNHAVNKTGAASQKIEHAFEYERSPLFSDAERAALRVVQAGGDSTDEDWEALKRHFDDRQIVEILAVAAFMAFLNWWNDTLAVELEDWPRAFAEEHLAEAGWTVGKHAGSNG